MTTNPHTTYAPAATRLLAKALDTIRIESTEARRSGHTFEQVILLGEALATIEQATREAMGSWATIAAARGASWAQIGAALGITRQAAQQRYGRMLVDVELPGIRAGADQPAPSL